MRNDELLFRALAAALTLFALWLGPHTVFAGDTSAAGWLQSGAVAFLLGAACGVWARRSFAPGWLVGAAVLLALTLLLVDFALWMLSDSEIDLAVGAVVRVQLVYGVPVVALLALARWSRLRVWTGAATRDAVFRAIRGDDAAALSSLLAEGASVDAHVPGRFGVALSPLGWAVQQRAPRCAALLVERGANRDAICGRGLIWAVTPSVLARRRGFADLEDIVARRVA